MINLGSWTSLRLLTRFSKTKKNGDSNSKNNTLLGSNVEGSTFNKHPSKSPRIDPENHPSRLSVVEVELEEIHLNFSQLDSNEVDVRILKQDPGETHGNV